MIIVAVMVGDWYSKRPDNMKGNKFEYNVDDFKNVPDEFSRFIELIFSDSESFAINWLITIRGWRESLEILLG